MPYSDKEKEREWRREWRKRTGRTKGPGRGRRSDAPVPHAVGRRRRKLHAYGLTLADYDLLLQAQEGACAICKGPCQTGRRLAVDHCHTTGRVRGLLCRHCNVMLGFAKDSVANLTAAVGYLTR